jgi:hypothetical protein
MNRFRLLQAGGVLLAMTALLGPTAAQAGSAVNHWGYTVGRQPATASYQPGAANSHDDQNSTVTIDRMSVGLYRVTYPHLAPLGGSQGVMLTTAISANGATCGMSDLGADGTSFNNWIGCFNRAGTPTNEKFISNYLLLQNQPGKAAYLYANLLSTSSYTPNPQYQYNSTATQNTITRSGPGWYDVDLPGLASNSGHVQVTTALPGGYCEVAGLAMFTTTEEVRVYCRNAAGTRTDSTFELVFTDGQGLKFSTSTGAAYLLADHPAALGYVPAATTSFQSNGGTSHVHRNSAGHYAVKLGGMAAGGAAEVTTYGTSSNRCEVSSLPTSGTPVTIGVVCVKPDGTPADTKFGLEYTH